MSIFFPDPKIDIGNVGFVGNCKLGRAASGEQLSELVEKIDEPVVIAVDGPWGSGKSHFLKLWTGAHTLENDGKAEVIYFDAFKHDYFDDPLIALIGEISNHFESKKGDSSALQTLKKWGGWLGRFKKPIVRASLAVATAGGTEVVGTIGDALIDVASAEATKAIDDFWENETTRRDAMDGFRDALTTLTIEKGSEEEPRKIVIIIDELDRCRPDFALDMLEIIKHFFAVENVIFVLGVNLVALENSVKARYGGEIDAEQYLQKFITLRFQLPSRLGEYEKENTWWIFFDSAVNDLGMSRFLSDPAKYYIEQLEGSNLISIREIQRFLTVLSLVPTNVGNNGLKDFSEAYISTIVGLAVIKVFRSKTYDKVRGQTLTRQDINQTFVGLDGFKKSVWDEIFSRKPNTSDHSARNGPFGPHGVNNSREFLLSLVDDFLETFEIFEPS